MTRWQKKRLDRIALLERAGAPLGMADANAEMVDRVMAGMGPDSSSAPAEGGAHAVANMACDHAPAFCNAAGSGNAYLNAYDLSHVKPVGKTRRRVDDAIASLTKGAPEALYFLAVEINGTGVRFYGDLCLVLKKNKVPSDAVVLNGNSYDLVRPPLSSETGSDAKLKCAADDFSGIWDQDVAAMAVLKVFDTRRSVRRWTTAQISDAILDDEDYLEVLKVGSFDPEDLHEVRISVASAAEETVITEQLRRGPTPSAGSLLWGKRRRDALSALRRAGVAVRIVSHTGRLKG